MILHTVSSSPFHDFSLQHCLKHFSEGDYLLLMNDAVISANTSNEHQAVLLAIHKQDCLFVLAADLKARDLHAEIGKVIDYIDFVNLTVRCQSQIAW